MPSNRRRLYDVQPRALFDRFVFVLVFVLGIGGSILLKIIGAHPFWVAGYAALILCLYAIVEWLGGRVRLEPETIGDNCYYLGFLYTLASLAFTLYQMAGVSGDGAHPIEIPEVISGFGVALSSTIVGVFLRVLFMQLRPDFVARDREIRADVNRAFGDFKKHMAENLRQMKGFSTQSIQMAAERDTRIRASSEEMLKAHQENLATELDLFSARLSEVVEKVTHGVAEKSIAALDKIKTEVAQLEKAELEKEINALQALRDRRKALLDEMAEQDRLMQQQSRSLEVLAKSTESALKAVGEPVEHRSLAPRGPVHRLVARFIGARD